MDPSVNVTWHEPAVRREPGAVVWFTGLSGSGKSTVANCVDQLLFQANIRSFVLDGDNIRHGLNAAPGILTPEFGEAFGNRFGLGFGAEDRMENIRRIGCVAEILCSAGLIALTAFVSPYRRDRERVRQVIETAHGKGAFVEVFVDTPLEICEQRDPKGLYRKARAGEIRGFTGIDDPYEPPLHAELVLAGGHRPPLELASDVVSWLREHRNANATGRGTISA